LTNLPGHAGRPADSGAADRPLAVSQSLRCIEMRSGIAKPRLD
jgi:hypothetical protein